jgi:hypothetical protein
MSEHFDGFHDNLKKIIHESKNINRISCELSMSLNNFANLLAEMSGLSASMLTHSRPMKELYSKLSESTVKISEKIWQTTVHVNEYLNGTLSYFKNQGTPLKTLYKEKDAAYVEVEAMKKKISKIVEKDQGVKKEITDKSKALQEKAGVLNYLCRDQTQKLISYSSNTLFSEIMEFCKKFSNEITGILTVLAMLQDNLEISKSFL